MSKPIRGNDIEPPLDRTLRKGPGMPTYVYRCQQHGDREIFLSFAEHGSPVVCGECLRDGVSTECIQVIAPPRIQKSTLKHEARFDHNLGGVVSCQADRDELLKKRSDEAGKNLVWTDPVDMKSKDEVGIAEKQREVDLGLV